VRSTSVLQHVREHGQGMTPFPNTDRSQSNKDECGFCGSGLTRVQYMEMTSEGAIPDAPAPIPGMRPIVLYLGNKYNLTLLEAEGGGHRYTVSKGPIEFAKSSESFPADQAGWRDAWTRLNQVDRNIRRDPAYERVSKVEPTLVVEQPQNPPAEPLDIVSLVAAIVSPAAFVLMAFMSNNGDAVRVFFYGGVLAAVVAVVTGFKSRRGVGRSTAGKVGFVLGLIEISVIVLFALFAWAAWDQITEPI
jgi:hypothetical protein